MEIQYLGHACFLIRHKGIKLVTDPFGKAVGFIQPKTEADIVTISHEHFDHNDLSQIKGDPVIVRGPGEYEIKGVSIIGIEAFHDNQQGKLRGKNTIYRLEIDEIKVCHLGDLGHKLTDDQIEVLDGVDALMLPVGGEACLEPVLAAEVVRQIEPSWVIPMHFKTKKHSRDFAKFKPVDEFIKIMDTEVKREKKLTINKLDLPEETEIMVLYG